MTNTVVNGLKMTGKGLGLTLAAIVSTPPAIVGGIAIGLGKGVKYIGHGVTAIITGSCGCCGLCALCCVSAPTEVIGNALTDLGNTLLKPAIATAKAGGCYNDSEDNYHQATYEDIEYNHMEYDNLVSFHKALQFLPAEKRQNFHAIRHIAVEENIQSDHSSEKRLRTYQSA